MQYVFRAPDGREIEVDRPMTDPPKIGATMKRGGVTYTRVVSQPTLLVTINPHFTSHSLPLAQKREDGSLYSPYSKEVDPKTRKPRFSSWKAVKDAEGFSKHNDGDHRIIYD